jgi:hypothetical protein
MQIRESNDPLVKVRILLRQLPESPLLRGFSISCYLLDLHKPSPTPPRYGKRYGIDRAQPAHIRDLLIAAVGRLLSERHRRLLYAVLSERHLDP